MEAKSFEGEKMNGPVRFSHLKAYGRSAMHGAYARTRPEIPPTDAMQLGSAVDALLFGHRKVYAWEGKVRRGKEWDAFQAEHTDGIILPNSAFYKARNMADALANCKVSEPLLKGRYQETILFRWNGLDCRATPDVIGEGNAFLTELKTSVSSDPNHFPWHSRRMFYHAQMRMQNLAIKDAAKDCFVVCIESAEPHPVQCYRIEERALLEGEKCLYAWAERMKVAEQSGKYLPYTTCIMPLDVPDNDEALIFPEEEE